MIIQLNNPEEEGYGLGTGFDCSWISRFKEEDERLFFGGSWRIKIEGITIVEVQINFQPVFVCLTQFDGMVSGRAMKKELVQKRDRKLLGKLIRNQLSEKKPSDAVDDHQKFVYRTFDCFCTNKAQIVLSLERLELFSDEGIRDHIMYKMRDSFEPTEGDPVAMSMEKQRTNLFRPSLLELFPNLRSILVRCS